MPPVTGAFPYNKLCRDCGRVRPAEEFSQRTNTADGLNTYCRSCANKRAKISREARLEAVRAYDAERYEGCVGGRPLKRPGSRVLTEAQRRQNRREYDRADKARRRAGGEHIHALVVLEKHDGACGICGEDVDPLDFHVDHILPVALGGRTTLDNLQPAHPGCNHKKGARVQEVLTCRQ